MSNVWFISDTHFNHANVIKFEADHRNFSSIEEHDEKLISNWNSVVRPKDIIWHLGDLWLGRSDQILRFHGTMNRLNGIKNLIRGNHDTLPIDSYKLHFKEIYGVWPKYGFIMSHIPLHPDSVERWGLNVHGHTHSKKVLERKMSPIHCIHFPDVNYYCVSVEQHKLMPISLDQIRKNLNDIQSNRNSR